MTIETEKLYKELGMTDNSKASFPSMSQDHADVIAFPPYVHLVFLVPALLVEFFWPTAIFNTMWQITVPILLITGVFFLGRSSAPEFRKKGTTLDVDTPTTAMVSGFKRGR